MNPKRLIAILAGCLMIITAGCMPNGLAPAPTTDPAKATADLQTAVAQLVQTQYAAQTQTFAQVPTGGQEQTQIAALGATMTAMAGGNPAPTQTLAWTDTPRPTNTPLFTPASNLPHVTVSVQTNCRSGPGKSYDILGVLKAGESAEVLGQDHDQGYWIIQLPSNPLVACWIWRANATPTGPTGQVPVFTAMPTATGAFGYSVVFDSVTSCSGEYFIKFKITNSGSLTFESNQVNATDKTASVTTTINRDSFPNYNACVLQQEDQNLAPGESGITMSDGFAANPSGHQFSATVQVCTLNGQAGTCIYKTLTFVP